MDSISLAEMDNVKLMNRMDTKCIFSVQLLNKLLTECRDHYKVLLHAGTRSSFYKTLYFDTAELKFYFDHHNGYAKRYKVRMRNYTESSLFYLEVKYKRYGRTDKKRIRINNFASDFSTEQSQFIDGITQKHFDIKPKLWNNFYRITLVNKYTPERVTIDTGLSFEQNGESVTMNNLVIGEIKQERTDFRSPILNLLKKNGIRPSGMSKYCLGIALMEKNIKRNSFKERILAIEKIEQ